jgi:uncharacterized protein YbcI
MAPVTRLAVSATEPDASPPAGERRGESARRTIDGPAAMTISNAVTEALKQSCGKGPTRMKAYTVHDDVAIDVQDMLTPLERTLVQDGHEQLVSEARQVLIGRAAKECRAAIEQATGRRVLGWRTEINPSADRARMLVQLQPL